MATLIYGELIKAQLQNSATDLTPVSTGLVYFNTVTGLKWYTGSAWKTAVDLDSSQQLSFKSFNGLTVSSTLDVIDNAPIRLFEQTVNGSNMVLLRAPVSLAADYTLVLPTAQGQANQFLKNDGAGNLSWAPASGGSGRNYLSDWNDASRSVGTVVTGLTSTGNRTSSQTSWGASATSDLTIANNATLPLRETGDFLIDSGTTTAGAFVESPMFNLDLVDLSKAVTVSFDITGVAADGNYDVVVIRYNSSGTYQETISVAGNASTGSPASAKLPTGTTTFKGFFITSNTQTDFYSVRIRKILAVNDDFQIDSLFVGPQSLATGAVVTEGVSFTPTLTGFGTVSTYPLPFKWYRLGGRMKVVGQFQAGTPTASTASILLPNNLTHSLPATGTGPAVIGSWVTNLASISNPKRGVILAEANTSKTLIYFGISEYATAQNSYTKQNGNEFTTASTLVNVEFELDIDQWSSNVTMADRAVEEYASNSSANDADDTTSFAYGASGSTGILQTTALTDLRKKRVRFTTPILATDRISIEIFDGFGWRPMESFVHTDGNKFAIGTIRAGYNSNLSTDSQGVGYRVINSTDVDVYFGRFVSFETAFSSSWSASFTGLGAKWRLRKVSGGAAVGFPVSARNIVGDTSGTAVPSGYVGEKRSFTARSISAVTTGYTANATALDTLPGGRWLVFFTMVVTAAASATMLECIISGNSNNDSTGNLDPESQISAVNTSGITVGAWAFPGNSFVLDVSSSQALYAKSQSYGANRSVSVDGYAVRIA